LQSAFREINETLMQRLSALAPLPLWMPSRQNRRFRAALKLLDGAVYRIIARRRDEGVGVGERSDLLSMLMGACDERDGQGMSDRQLRDEVLTILFAGHETTAVALSWALHLVAQHPRVEARLRSEVFQVLSDRMPTALDLARLSYTRMVVDEAMRLYPPVWLVGRGTNRDTEVGGYLVPRGTQVIFSPWVVHRSPSLWEEPIVFRPERFARGAAVPKHAYFPFISGARQCIGNNFALMEAQLILARLIQRYRFTSEPGYAVEPEPLITLRPRQGIRMRVAPA
jgi:cytochrome P450